eukprot:5979719-Pyramimonas_sp.AAC.1
MGPRRALTGRRNRVRVPPRGPSVELPTETTKRCTGRSRRMRVPPLGLSVELPMWPRNTALGGGTACEFRHWDL